MLFVFLKNLTSFFAWLQIMVSPSLVGAVIGGLAWLGLKGVPGIVLGGGCAALGVGLGIWWAEKARKEKGTLELVSRIRSQPEAYPKDLLLSVQTALLYCVTPNMRYVFVEPGDPVQLLVYFASDPSELDREQWEEVCSEVRSGLPRYERRLNGRAVVSRLRVHELAHLQYCVYGRYEDYEDYEGHDKAEPH